MGNVHRNKPCIELIIYNNKMMEFSSLTVKKIEKERSH